MRKTDKTMYPTISYLYNTSRYRSCYPGITQKGKQRYVDFSLIPSMCLAYHTLLSETKRSDCWEDKSSRSETIVCVHFIFGLFNSGLIITQPHYTEPRDLETPRGVRNTITRRRQIADSLSHVCLPPPVLDLGIPRARFDVIA